MSTTLKIRDETTSGGDGGEYTLEVLTERITLRELIRARVYQEVRDYNVRQPEYFRGLVQPSDAERTLNGYKMRRRRRLDPQRQFKGAIQAFNRNGYFVLVNDRQVEELEEEIEIRPDTTVAFLKLVPLIGG